MFCIHCRRISPAGSVFCAYCPGAPRSFNGVRCGSGHTCPIGIQTCPTCGSTEFSEWTRGIPTAWLAKLATLLLLLGGWKIGLAHLGSILDVIETVAAYCFGVLTNTNRTTLPFLVQTGLFYALLGWILGWWLRLLPGGGGAVGTLLRNLPVTAFRLLVRWLPRLLLSMGRAIVRLSGLSTPRHQKIGHEQAKPK